MELGEERLAGLKLILFPTKSVSVTLRRSVGMTFLGVNMKIVLVSSTLGMTHSPLVS